MVFPNITQVKESFFGNLGRINEKLVRVQKSQAKRKGKEDRSKLGLLFTFWNQNIA